MRMKQTLMVHWTRAARVHLAGSQRAPRASNLAELSARRARPTSGHISCPIDENETNIDGALDARRARPICLECVRAARVQLA